MRSMVRLFSLILVTFLFLHPVASADGPKIELPKVDLKGPLTQVGELPKTPVIRITPIVPEPITAPVQVWIAAQPLVSKIDRVSVLKSHALSELNELKSRLWQVSFHGLTAFLIREHSSATEDEVREARVHARKYMDLLRQIEALTGEKAEAERRYAERLKNLTVFPNGRYTVQTSDSTVITRYYPDNPPRPSQSEPAQKQKPKGTHWENRYDIEKTLIKVGFDKDGKPTFRMGYDVVRKRVEVPD